VHGADPRDQRIADLEAIVEAQRHEICEIVELKAALKAALERIAVLEERLNRNSRNSSKPPSSDPPWQKPSKGHHSKRKHGAQPGHEKHERQLVPAEKVTETVELKPTECEACGAKLLGNDEDPLIHQVIEVPKVEPHVTEYHIHTLRCGCGACTTAQLPDGVTASGFGTGCKALVTLLTGKYRLSKQSVVELMSDVFGIDLSMGMVSKMERQVSAALAFAYDEAKAHVKKQPVLHADETGWREAGKKAWLWTAVAVTTMVAVFKIAAKRSAEVAKELLGDGFEGIGVSDRYTSYLWLKCRQLCWAHLLRDFQAMVDRGGGGRKIGLELLHEAKRMFKWWHKVRDGTMPRERFIKNMSSVINRVGELLEKGTHCRSSKTASVCREIQALEKWLWAFVYVDGVEPTNNAAERALRFAVIWRKICYGTQSETGSRFVERMLTVVTTLRMQERGVLPFLKASIDAHTTGSEAPSLLFQPALSLESAA